MYFPTVSLHAPDGTGIISGEVHVKAKLTAKMDLESPKDSDPPPFDTERLSQHIWLRLHQEVREVMNTAGLRANRDTVKVTIDVTYIVDYVFHGPLVHYSRMSVASISHDWYHANVLWYQQP